MLLVKAIENSIGQTESLSKERRRCGVIRASFRLTCRVKVLWKEIPKRVIVPYTSASC